MKVLFIFPRSMSYDSRSVREEPSGGTEKAVIYLGEALQQRGHDVEWMTTLDQSVDAEPDVVISQHAHYFEHFPKAKKIWWVHHFPDQPIIKEQAVWARCYADLTVSLSQCQHDRLKDELKINSHIIGHGVWWSEIDKTTPKQKDRYIYASTPFRGLERLPGIIKELQGVNPAALFDVCSSLGVYGDASKDVEYKAIFDELGTLPGVTVYPALNQKQLYSLYASADYFLYPSTWPETYCLALDEAMAHCCKAMVSSLGAMQERVPWCDFIMNESGDYSYQESEFYRERSRRYALYPADWMEIAGQWEELF